MLAIIQARLGSKRLPGKVLMEINGKPLLQYVIDRVRMACRTVVVSCPINDVRVIGRAVDCRVVGQGGDENDVLKRIQQTLRDVLGDGEQEFVRICGDSPLIDPAIISYIAAAHKVSHPQNTSLIRGMAFVTSNTQPRTWPGGQCVEISDIAGFLTGNKVGRVGRGNAVGDELTDYDREHVMPWFYRNCPTVNVMNPLGDFSAGDMVVDTQEDFVRISQLIFNMERPHWAYGWREIMEMMQ